MSGETAAYVIEITGVHVPDALLGVPLPIEVVTTDGCVEHGLLNLQEGAKTSVTVTQPGTCLVRAKLPSGKWIAVKTSVEEKAAGQTAAASATLDFGTEVSTTTIKLSPANSDREIPVGRLPDVQVHKFAKSLPPSLNLLTDISRGVSQLTRQGARRLMQSINFGNIVLATAESAEDSGSKESFQPPEMAEPEGGGVSLSLDYGLFDKWTTAASDDSAQPRDILVIDNRGTLVTNLPGSVTFPQNPGSAADTSQWKPLLVRAKMKQSDGTQMVEALLVCPPSLSDKPLTILPDTDTRANPDAPPLHILTESDDRTADALFAYVRNGSLETARQAASAYVAQAQALLQSKVENPMAAALAAYALLRLGNTEHKEWVANLAGGFPYLADGAVLYGWYLIRLGQAERAGAQFRAALSRGVPVYSEGVRLLRDGLNFLCELYPEDAQVRKDTALASSLVASANLSSELTCLRIGKHFSVRID